MGIASLYTLCFGRLPVSTLEALRYCRVVCRYDNEVTRFTGVCVSQIGLCFYPYTAHTVYLL